MVFNWHAKKREVDRSFFADVTMQDVEDDIDERISVR